MLINIIKFIYQNISELRNKCNFFFKKVCFIEKFVVTLQSLFQGG
jgi:hypothetical protein